MSSDPLLVGIDLGTTGSRCMIFDVRGQCVASAYREYPLNFIRPGWTEQSLPDMLEATADACREAIDVVDIEALEQALNRSAQPVLAQKLLIGGCRCRESLGHANAETGQFAYHLAKRCVLAPDAR